MSEAKYTPGPWLIRKGDEWTCSIVTLHGHNVDGDPMYWEVASFNRRRDEAEENALLIASAPDLLEALEWMVQRIDEGGYPDGKCLIAARAAIAKATGGQQ
jgi:hypothetical protein